MEGELEKPEEETLSDEESSLESSLQPSADSENVSSETTEDTAEKEYTKERFDGLMSAWQKDRQKLLDLEKSKDVSPVNGEKSSENDAAIDYIYKAIRQKEEAEKNVQDELVKRELEEVKVAYPKYSENELLRTAIKYSKSEKNPISLHTAAQILSDLDTLKTFKSDDADKKKAASSISGRAGVAKSSGLKTFNPDKDRGKSFKELIDEGLEELK